MFLGKYRHSTDCDHLENGEYRLSMYGFSSALRRAVGRRRDQAAGDEARQSPSDHRGVHPHRWARLLVFRPVVRSIDPWGVIASPSLPDVRHFRCALDQARQRLNLTTLLADAGYDSETSHVYAREQCGVRSLIPAKIGRSSSKPPRGRYRRTMKSRIHNTRYNQRVQVETTISMLQRLHGSALRARKDAQQRREASRKAITLDIMIL